jgi:hypothetical protein
MTSVITETRPIISVVTPSKKKGAAVSDDADSSDSTSDTDTISTTSPSLPSLGTTENCTSIFAGALVHFTHFVPLTYTPTIHDIRNGYKRACAFECKLNAPNIDYIIPMMVNTRISFILVQVKNIVKHSDAKEITVKGPFPKIKELRSHDVPFIAVYLHLGSTVNQMATSWNPTMKRLSIDIRGIHVERFPFLTEVIFSFLFLNMHTHSIHMPLSTLTKLCDNH